MADRVGQQLGSYQLMSLLGEGGFAEVYLGEHIHLGTQSAIKVLHTQLSSEDMDKFRTEARTIARLIHPHIVRIFDFGVEGKTPFLVMDYAPNGTLRQQHPKGTALPLPKIVAYVKQVADALQYAHDEKLIHRDIKPENMLLGRRNEVLLSDFGIALVAQSSRYQSTQEVVGTVAYMSPEQIQGKPRPASDQYSLGIIVYEWLTGDRPFHGSFTELCTQHMFAAPPPLHEKDPTVSPIVEQVVMLALAKDPHQRFLSVQAFANALEQASQADAPMVVRPMAPTIVEPTIVAASVAEPPRMSMQAPVKGPLSPTQIATPVQSVGSILYIYQGHETNVEAVAWSPDGKNSASGDGNGLVQVWGALTGTKSIIYRGHSKWISAVAWSPDGTRLATGSHDGTVQIWDAANGSKIFTYREHASPISTVAWSPDSRHLASGSWNNRVQVWNAANGSRIFSYSHLSTVHTVAVNAVGWSPTGSYLASAGSDKMVQVWEVNTWRNLGAYNGHTDVVLSFTWSPDGKRIVSGGYDQTLQVWDVATGRNIFTYRGHLRMIRTVAWSPNGTRIASGSNVVQIWDAVSGKTIFTYNRHARTVKSVAWSPDGKYIASAGDDKSVQVWVAS